MAYKVFVQRALEGIPVHGDKLVFSFSLGGELRKVIGRWHEIDLTASRLATSAASEGVIARAFEELKSKDVDPSLADRVWVRTRYRTTEVQAGVATPIHLAGYVWVSRPLGQGSLFDFNLE